MHLGNEYDSPAAARQQRQWRVLGDSSSKTQGARGISQKQVKGYSQEPSTEDCSDGQGVLQPALSRDLRRNPRVGSDPELQTSCEAQSYFVSAPLLPVNMIPTVSSACMRANTAVIAQKEAMPPAGPLLA